MFQKPMRKEQGTHNKTLREIWSYCPRWWKKWIIRRTLSIKKKSPLSCTRMEDGQQLDIFSALTSNDLCFRGFNQCRGRPKCCSYLSLMIMHRLLGLLRWTVASYRDGSCSTVHLVVNRNPSDTFPSTALLPDTQTVRMDLRLVWCHLATKSVPNQPTNEDMQSGPKHRFLSPAPSSVWTTRVSQG